MALDEKESKLVSLCKEVEEIRLQLLQMQSAEGHSDTVRRFNHHLPGDYLSHGVKTSLSKINRLSPAGDADSELRTSPVTSSCNVTLPYPAHSSSQGMPHASRGDSNDVSVSFTSKAPLVAAAGVDQNLIVSSAENAGDRLDGVANTEHSAVAGFQRSPSTALSAATATVRQAKSADLSDVSLSMVKSHNTSVIGGSCPSELSSGLLSVATGPDSGKPVNTLSLQQSSPVSSGKSQVIFRHLFVRCFQLHTFSVTDWYLCITLVFD